MAGINFLEIISVISFLFSMLTVITPFAGMKEMFLLFIFSTAITTIYSFLQKKSKLFDILLLLIMMPTILWEHSSLHFNMILFVSVFAYMKAYFRKGSYYEYVVNLKKSYIVYIVVTIIMGTLGDSFHNFIHYSSPFLIIYLLSTITLVRSLRYINANLGVKKIREINIRYFSIIMFVSVMVSLEKAREFVVALVIKGYFLFVDIVFVILGYPIYLLIRLLQGLIDRLKAGEEEIVLDIGEAVGDDLFGFTKGMEHVEVAKPYAKNVMLVVIILLILYIINKLIKKSDVRSIKEGEVVEEREHISEGRKRRTFFRERYPKELNEQIRYYYRRYLNKMDKKKIAILKSNTSLELNKKAENIFEGDIEEIRQIYIDSRYGEKEVDKSKVEQIERLYKDL